MSGGWASLNLYGMLSGIGDDLRERRQAEEVAKFYGSSLDNLTGPAAAAPLPGGAPAAAPAARPPSFAALQGSTPSGAIGGLINQTTQKFGLDPAYLPKLAMIESSGNPSARNPSGASGLLQFMPKTAAAYGLSNPFDPAASLEAGGRLTLDNKAALARSLGRDPTNGELYLAHQQGAGGASKLLANPNARAADLVGVKAVVQNGGTPDMSAGEFASKWTSKFDGNRRVAQADVPAAGAQPAGYAVPGQPSGPGVELSPALSAGQSVPPAAQTGASRLSPQQAQQLRGMLASGNPTLQAQAVATIQKLQQPQKWETKEIGGRVVQTDDAGNIRAVPGFERPTKYGFLKDDNGNVLVTNENTGGITQGVAGRDQSRRDLTTAEKEARGIPADTFSQIDANGQVYFPGKPANAVTIDQRGETEFAKTSAAGIGKRFLALSEEGDAAKTDMALLGQVRALGGAINTENLPVLRGKLAEYGIRIGNDVGAIQAYNSLIDRLTPQQRIPGAGATSDFDAALFKSSLPRLMNTPEGNALIVSTLEGLAQHKQDRAIIAEKALTGELKPADAVKALRELQSPNLALRAGLSELGRAGKLNALPQGAPAMPPGMPAPQPRQQAPAQQQGPQQRGQLPSATNPQTGEKIYLLNGKWGPLT